MKKIVLTLAALLALATPALALDGSLTSEFKAFQKDGYRISETELNVGHEIKILRPYVNLKYTADNVANMGLKNVSNEYKAGADVKLGKQITVGGGLGFLQGLQTNSKDDRFVYGKVGLTF